MKRPRSLEPLPVTFGTDIAGLVFGKSPETIKSWCRSGKIPALKVDGEWIIYKENVRKLLEEGNNHTKGGGAYDCEKKAANSGNC